MPAEKDRTGAATGIRLPGVQGLQRVLLAARDKLQPAAWFGATASAAAAGGRARVWVLDDDAAMLTDLEQLHQREYRAAMELECFRTSVTGDDDFVASLKARFAQALQANELPDLVVLDVNLAFGGYRSDEVAAALRCWPGGQGVALIFATGRPLDQAAVNDGARAHTPHDDAARNASRSEQESALRLTHGAETLLFGKGANRGFVDRVIEGVHAWRIQARRRAWARLLAELADQLDDSEVDRDAVAKTITSYLHLELKVGSAVLRWRRDDNHYERLASAGLSTQLSRRDVLDPATVPVLARLIKVDAAHTSDRNLQSRKPLLIEGGLKPEDCGPDGQDLVGMRYLGAAAVLRNRCHALFSLLRLPSEAPFEEADLDGLKAVAALLASALVRAEDLVLASKRQESLLEFAHKTAQCRTEAEVCSRMVCLLHELVHDSKDEGRVTCRLVNFTSGDLDPTGVRRGYRTQVKPKPIRVDAAGAHNSMYARTVFNRTPAKGVDLADCHELTDDVRVDPGVGKYTDTTEGETRSALCVAMVVGKHAIGAVNLEHRSVRRYRGADVRFVHAVAAVATQALLNVAMHRFELSMVSFAGSYRHRSLQELEQQLDDLLFEFTGYSALVMIDATDVHDASLPWRAKAAKTRLKGADGRRLLAEVNVSYQSQWANSEVVPAEAGSAAKEPWLAKELRSGGWKKQAAAYTDDSAEFLSLDLAPGLQQTADAVLWLKAHDNAAPHRALLLLWALPPPMDNSKIELLGQLADLFSGLQAQAQYVDDQVQARLIGEQQGKMGAVMQHFRHRLKAVTSSLISDVSDLGGYLLEGNLTRARQVWTHVSQTADLIESSFHASRAYVKEVKRERVNLLGVAQSALSDEVWNKRMKQLQVEIELNIAPTFWIDTDPVVASFAIFSVLENAHDALEGAASAHPQIRLSAHASGDRVALDVIDNGPGVDDEMKKRIFSFGATSKSDGLGSALAFARSRLLEAGGHLRLVEDGAPGAHFQFDWRHVD